MATSSLCCILVILIGIVAMRLIYILLTIVGALVAAGAAGFGGGPLGGAIPSAAPAPLIGAIGAPVLGGALLTLFIIRYLRRRG
jgi:hypothetical protein